MSYSKFQKLFLGQSLFEVLVAVGISALILLGVVSLATSSVRNSNFSKNNSQATKYTQEEMEWLREQRDADWSAFMSSVGGGGCSGTLSWGGNCSINPTFIRTASFTCSFFNPGPPPTTTGAICNASANIVDAQVSVTWQDAQGSH
jgi:Tfp pilus assembly protein PilV